MGSSGIGLDFEYIEKPEEELTVARRASLQHFSMFKPNI